MGQGGWEIVRESVRDEDSRALQILGKLAKLRDDGLLTEEEYEEAERVLLASAS
jgi:hypothetical protein